MSLYSVRSLMFICLSRKFHAKVRRSKLELTKTIRNRLEQLLLVVQHCCNVCLHLRQHITAITSFFVISRWLTVNALTRYDQQQQQQQRSRHGDLSYTDATKNTWKKRIIFQCTLLRWQRHSWKYKTLVYPSVRLSVSLSVCLFVPLFSNVTTIIGAYYAWFQWMTRDSTSGKTRPDSPVGPSVRNR